MERVHLLIEGRVQGVWFRDSTQKRATELGLVGFVRNLPDGRVEVVAEGTTEQLDALITFSGKGPELAVVDNVDVKRSTARGDLGAAFRITH